MRPVLTFYILILCYGCGLTSAINILCLFDVPSPSHHIWNTALVKALAHKGYNLTIISPDIEQNPPTNLTYIHLEQVYPALYGGDSPLDLIELAKTNTITAIKRFYDFSLQTCVATVNSQGFRTLLNYPDNFKFDLIISDISLSPCLYGFVDRFYYPPLVGVSAFNNPPFSQQLIGGDKHYSFVPYMGLRYGTKMNFFQRMLNFFVRIYDEMYRKYISLPAIDREMRRGFIHNSRVPYAGDLEKRTKLLLVNTHPSIDYPEPTLPNLVQVAGLQIREPRAIPKNLDEFINTSQKGFILFSLGTNVRSDLLPLAVQQTFLDAFKEFPEYKFLWKFESDLKLEIPGNVMIQNWMPQTDLLGHSKIRAFISHSGLLSTHEAIWFGVPIIAVPFFSDQNRNSYRITELGIGVKLDFQTMTVQNIKDALNSVLRKSSIRTNVKKVSQNFRDRPMQPLELAVWWIEYVLRTSNIEHLQSPTLELGVFKTNLYDIGLFIVLTVVLFIVLIRRLCFKRSKSVPSKWFTSRPSFNHFVEFFLLYTWGAEACDVALNSTAIQRVLTSKQKYDVILLEQFNTDCMAAVAHKLNVPFISLSSCSLMPWAYDRVATPINPSYTPALFMGLTDKMNYQQRLANWLAIYGMQFLFRIFVDRTVNQQVQKYLGKGLPDIREITKETSLIFVNTHYALSGPKVLSPQVIELGGVHIKEAKPIEESIKNLLDSAEHGVIYISWGSMIKAESLPVDKREALLSAIGMLKETVLWKWENETLPNQPANLFTRKWMQQRDILCHPNVKLFMSHGGLLGSSEAAYCGVPVIATPMYGDQFLNSAAIQNRRMGEILDFETMSKDLIYGTIMKVLQPEYAENAKKVSHAYRMRPNEARNLAVWWVEQVAATGGLPLMKSPSVHLPWYIYYSMDVYATFLVILGIVIYSWVWVIRRVMGKKIVDKKTKIH